MDPTTQPQMMGPMTRDQFMMMIQQLLGRGGNGNTGGFLGAPPQGMPQGGSMDGGLSQLGAMMQPRPISPTQG